MHSPRGIARAITAASLVSVASVGRADAQIAPGDKTVQLPPPPAPVLAGADQQVRTIYPLIRFDLPPTTTAILVSRRPPGSTASVLLTPTPIPIASVMKYPYPDRTYYVWPDNTLPALGTYSYAIAAVQSDGRTGVSSWLSYTPQLYEATNVTVQKTSSYSAVVYFTKSLLGAKAYRLYGTGIPAFGVEATIDRTLLHGSVQMGNLAAGTYNWILRAEFDPGIRTSGVPVSVTLP